MPIEAWLTRLLGASFRGVGFHIERHEGIPAGRRLAVHEYPGRDLPYAEDMGHRTRTFTVDGYVIGAAYYLERDRLIEACSQPGPGTLIHPYLGPRRVECMSCRVMESSQERRMARFSLDFLDAGVNIYPTGIINTGAGVQSEAENAFETMVIDFLEEFLL